MVRSKKLLTIEQIKDYFEIREIEKNKQCLTYEQSKLVAMVRDLYDSDEEIMEDYPELSDSWVYSLTTKGLQTKKSEWVESIIDLYKKRFSSKPHYQEPRLKGDSLILSFKSEKEAMDFYQELAKQGIDFVARKVPSGKFRCAAVNGKLYLNERAVELTEHFESKPNKRFRY